MATIIINGQDHTLPEGEKLNAIQAAKLAGSTSPITAGTPRSPSSPTAGCARSRSAQKDAKTGEIKMIPKLVPGCQTPAKDGTVLVTDSAKVKEHQRMIMEYLLINHPLDCPVCDQAGMCGLQDYSYEYGQSSHRFVEERTVNPKKDVSDAIQLNQDRCIMCTRCVRFTREITQTGELQVMSRGNHAEIDIFPGHPIDNPLAGNVVDLCPVGALLDKDFLHKQRAWFLSKHDAVCTRCSTGCNIKAEENRGQVWRFTGPGTTRSSTTTGSATRGEPATSRPTTRTCSPRCYAKRSRRRPRLGPDRPGAQLCRRPDAPEDRSAMAARSRGRLAVR